MGLPSQLLLHSFVSCIPPLLIHLPPDSNVFRPDKCRSLTSQLNLNLFFNFLYIWNPLSLTAGSLTHQASNHTSGYQSRTSHSFRCSFRKSSAFFFSQATFASGEFTVTGQKQHET